MHCKLVDLRVSSALRARLGHFPHPKLPPSHLSGNEWDINK